MIVHRGWAPQQFGRVRRAVSPGAPGSKATVKDEYRSSEVDPRGSFGTRYVSEGSSEAGVDVDEDADVDIDGGGDTDGDDPWDDTDTPPEEPEEPTEPTEPTEPEEPKGPDAEPPENPFDGMPPLEGRDLGEWLWEWKTGEPPIFEGGNDSGDDSGAGTESDSGDDSGSTLPFNPGGCGGG